MDFLEKLAATSEFKKWEQGLPDDARRERDLIKIVQKDTDRTQVKKAMKELTRRYKGVISQSVKSSGLSSVMDHNTAFQHGLTEFQSRIKNSFDLTKQVKPITYMHQLLRWDLSKKKQDFMNTTSKMSVDLTEKAGYISLAKDFLRRQLGREPTPDEALKYIKEELGWTSVTRANYDRIQSIQKKEFSGDELIGAKGGDSRAEAISIFDVKNVSAVTPMDIYKNTMVKNQIEDLLPTNFTRQERRFLRNLYGLGQFQNKRAKSLNDAALNNNMTHYEARKVRDKLLQLLRSRGVVA
jgi:DNA-directed RNA polymerase specialized sigma subunit